jgi:hypothetical protein
VAGPCEYGNEGNKYPNTLDAFNLLNDPLLQDYYYYYYYYYYVVVVVVW